MPYYEYRCAGNGRTLEVRHGMDERLETWGELADRAGTEPGETPLDTPVERLLSAPVPLTSSRRSSGPDVQGCGAGCACVPQA